MTDSDRRSYTIYDILHAGYTLEPMICVHCWSHEVAYLQSVGDAYCGNCGKWQLDPPPEGGEKRSNANTMYVLIDPTDDHGWLQDGERYVIGDDPHTYTTGDDARESRDTYRQDRGNDEIEIYRAAPIRGDDEALTHLDTGGIQCPSCQSFDVEDIKWRMNVAGEAQCLVWCRSCQAEWTNLYTLTGLVRGRI